MRVSPRTPRRAALAVFLLSLAAALPGFLRVPYAVDFQVFYDAGRKFLEGQSPYRTDIHLQFKYAPLAAELFGRLWGAWSLEQAFQIHYWVFAAGWLAWTAVCGELCLDPSRIRTRESRILTALALLLAAFANPWIEELSLGQVNLIPLALLTLCAWDLCRPSTAARDLRVGIFISWAILIKLYSALLLPVILFKGRLRVLAFFVLATLFFGVGLLAILRGWDFTLEQNRVWLANLSGSTETLLSSRFNASLLGVLLKAGLPGAAAKGLWAVCVLGYLALLFRVSRTPVPHPGRLLAIVLAGVTLLNPLVWAYWSLFLLPALLLAGMSLSARFGPRRAIALLAWAPLLQAHHSHLIRDGGLAVAALGLLSAERILSGSSSPQ